MQQLTAEWGFTDDKTADTFVKSRKRLHRQLHLAQRRQKAGDPLHRLSRLKKTLAHAAAKPAPHRKGHYAVLSERNRPANVRPAILG